MINIEVTASRAYQVLIGSGLLCQLGEQLQQRTKAQKAAIVSDSNVFPLYGAVAKESLEKAGFQLLRCADRMLDDGGHGTTWFVIARK